jgi:hypothetical protein
LTKPLSFFYKARTAFFQRLERKNREASIVTQLIERLPKNNPKTSGYASQIKSISKYIHLIIANIDYLLGSPCNEKMFAVDEIKDDYSKKIYNSFEELGLISPTLLCKWPVEDWQIRQFRRKYKLNQSQITVSSLYCLIIFRLFLKYS